MTTDGFDLHTAMEEAAVVGKPRVFAIYGTFKREPDEPLLGWGMELPTGGALFRYAGERASTHTADTAERLLEVQSIIGDVQLKWLDE